ncbi:ankyrin repeat-containing protein [Artemisia annua]|uniref:Ankyrin repeat-containing protein n=1 Tax=Artemisia annua TaxID=35608 RepID=A0A2U1MAD3_ARTAN|nr:ankyrin repeat-containing protein [Artemisia annua]
MSNDENEYDVTCSWALGVLIYFMPQSEMSFGSWRENELDTFAKNAKGQFTLPKTFTPEVVELINKNNILYVVTALPWIFLSECIKYLLREEIDQKIRDEHGWTPLRYAVHHNNASATAELVDADPSIVNQIMKEDGINTFAVHIAASQGYCETLKVLMTHCPGCSELVDEKGKNILHVAVENKKTEVIELIYQDESYTSLVNEKDKDGNTPMHLLMVSDLEMMEVAIDYRRVAASSHVRDKRSLSIKVIPWDEKRTEEEFKLEENLLIVATLIATASFAAAFTVPGGFDGNEGSKQGMPILLRKTAFKVFMLANTGAFASSCSVLGSHIFLLVYRLKPNEVDEENRKSIHTRIAGMYYITGFALLNMIVAFITGVYVVLSPIRDLAIYLCVLPIWVPAYTIFFPTILGSPVDTLISLLWSFRRLVKEYKI